LRSDIIDPFVSSGPVNHLTPSASKTALSGPPPL
jgi:hypothetical protein